MTAGRERPAAPNADGPAPSGTSVRFAVLVLAMTGSAAALFGYLWVIAQPARDAAARACLSVFPSGLFGVVGSRAAGRCWRAAYAATSCR